MTLRTQIIADATAVFLNTAEFAESVTYHPYKFQSDTLRADRVIDAVVVRGQILPLSADSNAVAPVYRVAVANDTTTGINSDEIDLGKDALSFPPRDGKTAVRHTITDIDSQDFGMMVLICVGDGG